MGRGGGQRGRDRGEERARSADRRGGPAGCRDQGREGRGLPRPARDLVQVRVERVGDVDQFVFGYGSLVEALDAGGRGAHLEGWRGRWPGAMDNSVDLPGYKYYVDPRTGERPRVFVAFLDLAPDPHTRVNGVLVPVTDERLQELDTRERNYERRLVASDPPTYAYIGTPEARARFETGPTVIARAYRDMVHAGFEQLGETHADLFAGSTDPPAVPILDLER